MAVMLIMLNARDTKRDYEGFVQFVESYPWIKLSELTYVIETNETAGSLYFKIHPLINHKDNVYIFTLTNPWGVFGSEAINDWLSQRLP